jgi:hypothetical protein
MHVITTTPSSSITQTLLVRVFIILGIVRLNLAIFVGHAHQFEIVLLAQVLSLALIL